MISDMNKSSYTGRTRVKICGFTNVGDALAAARLGVDAVGLVFYPPSPRNVDLESAKRIALELPPFVSIVGLFVDERADRIDEVLDQVPLDLIQFHGTESPADCGRFGRPYIKAVRMQSGTDVAAEALRYPETRGLLLDAYQPGTHGGTGVSFEWERIPKTCSKPIVLAGGLSAENVCQALSAANVSAVDVSSGVEAGRGIKDESRMAEFIQEVNRFDRTKQ